MGGNNTGRSIFTYDSLVHALSGAAGSVIAMATFFPLDTVRSRLQLEENREAKNTLAMIRELTSKEGPHTLYRGMVPVLQSLCASNFVYFYTFHGLKMLRSRRNQTAGNDLLVASIAGVINVLTTTPLWVVNTRLKMKGIGSVTEKNNNDYNTLYDGLLHIWKYEGLEKLWAGTFPSLLLVANPAIQFMTYESIKRKIDASSSGIQPPAWVFFAIGAIAKTVATTLTYPLQLIQTKLRHGHKYPDLPPNAGTIQILFYILKKQGILGLYKGMEAKLLQTVLTAALMFLTYEKISRFVFRILLHRPVSPHLPTPKSVSKWLSEEADFTKSLNETDSALTKIHRKRFKSVLKFWSKLKIRKDSKKRLNKNSVTSSLSLRHAAETMNTQVRNEIPKTKKSISSRQNSARTKQNTNVKPVIAYDYDAAISQPDVPNFLGQKFNTGLPIRKKGLYTRGKNKLSTKKNTENVSQATSISKSQNKEDEVNSIPVEEGTAENETTSTEGESTPIFSKKNFAKDDTQEDSQRDSSEDKNRSENEKNLDSISPRSTTSQKKDSKIPRAKVIKSPVVVQISRNDSVKRLSLTSSKKSFDSISHKKEVLKAHAYPKFVSSKQQNSCTFLNDKHEPNDETIITETSPAIIGSASDPSTFTVLQRLKQSHNYRSCDDCNPESSCRDIDDTLSESRSSPERRYISSKWRRSLKHRKYIDTSSDDFDVSSDYSSQSSEKKIKNHKDFHSSVAPLTKVSLTTKSSSRTKNRRGK
uniref:Peroxisomal membrane protein PMP34 n=1 Tax=Vespula pensylvanica TaxID=30213 RepID=A0A834UG29_VESPE|nr:hypothetical protein H0235_000063 [Vespula pensylvanica]